MQFSWKIMEGGGFSTTKPSSKKDDLIDHESHVALHRLKQYQ
jgi:hypothetical protein